MALRGSLERLKALRSPRRPGQPPLELWKPENLERGYRERAEALMLALKSESAQAASGPGTSGVGAHLADKPGFLSFPSPGRLRKVEEGAHDLLATPRGIRTFSSYAPSPEPSQERIRRLQAHHASLLLDLDRLDLLHAGARSPVPELDFGRGAPCRQCSGSGREGSVGLGREGSGRERLSASHTSSTDGKRSSARHSFLWRNDGPFAPDISPLPPPPRYTEQGGETDEEQASLHKISRISNRYEWSEAFERMQVSSIDGSETVSELGGGEMPAAEAERRPTEEVHLPTIAVGTARYKRSPLMVDTECQTELLPQEEDSICMQAEAFTVSPVRKKSRGARHPRSPGMWESLSESDALWLESAYVPARRPVSDQELMELSAVHAEGMECPPGLSMRAEPLEEGLVSPLPSASGGDQASEDMSASTPVAKAASEASITIMRLDSLRDRERPVRTLNFMSMSEASN